MPRHRRKVAGYPREPWVRPTPAIAARAVPPATKIASPNSNTRSQSDSNIDFVQSFSPCHWHQTRSCLIEMPQKLSISILGLLLLSSSLDAQNPTLRQLAVETQGHIGVSTLGCGPDPTLQSIVSGKDLAIEGTVLS